MRGIGLSAGAIVFTAETLLLGRDTITLILRDPVLPEELLASQSRALLIREMERYQDQALPLWKNWVRAPAGAGA